MKILFGDLKEKCGKGLLSNRKSGSRVHTRTVTIMLLE
jgi:hypothetical protein